MIIDQNMIWINPTSARSTGTCWIARLTRPLHVEHAVNLEILGMAASCTEQEWGHQVGLATSIKWYNH